MELIKSWEFNKSLLDRNIAIILRIYYEFLTEKIPSIDDIVDAIENLNRQVLEKEHPESDIDELFEEATLRGDFACMDVFVMNILEKYKHIVTTNQEFILGPLIDENDESVFLINDCQNVIGEFIEQNDSLISQGTNFTQVFKKPDLTPKLEAGV